MKRLITLAVLLAGSSVAVLQPLMAQDRVVQHKRHHRRRRRHHAAVPHH